MNNRLPINYVSSVYGDVGGGGVGGVAGYYYYLNNRLPVNYVSFCVEGGRGRLIIIII